MVLSLALLAAPAVAAEWSPCPADAPCKVMPLGDSITDGYNVPGGYRVRLEDLAAAAGTPVDFVGSLVNGPGGLADQDHEGHSGWRTDQIQWILRDRLATYDPDVVLVHLGTNDILQDHDVTGAPARLDAIVGACLGADADRVVIVAALVPVGWRAGDLLTEWYNGEVEAMVARRQALGQPVRFVDMHAALTARDLADGVHPNVIGYGKMADAWWGQLADLLR